MVRATSNDGACGTPTKSFARPKRSFVVIIKQSKMVSNGVAEISIQYVKFFKNR
jgi:hypothetical protein